MELTRLIRYVVTGLAANGLGLAIFQALVWAGAAPELASFLCFFPAFFTAYLLNKLWSFESQMPHRTALIRYALATAAVVALQIGIVSVLYRLFGVWPFAAQVVALAIATPISFLMMSWWVFEPGRSDQRAANGTG